MSRDLLWPALVLALVLVGGFVALEVSDHATAEYVLFISGPAITALVGLVLTKRVAAVKDVTDVVAHQTNSLLSTRLTSIDAALSDAKIERETIAGSPGSATPSGDAG